MINSNNILKLKNFIIHFLATHAKKNKDNKIFKILIIEEFDNKVIKTFNYFNFDSNKELIKINSVVKEQTPLIGILTYQKDGIVSYNNIIKNKILILNNYINIFMEFIKNEFHKFGINVNYNDISYNTINSESSYINIIRNKLNNKCLVYE